MRPQHLLPALLLLTACGTRRDKETPPSTATEVVEAADKGGSSLLSIAEYESRSTSDRVEAMYAELLKADPSLQAMEKTIATLRTMKADSLAPWASYVGTSQGYYNDALGHCTPTGSFGSGIADTLLGSRLRAVVEASQARQTARMMEYQALASTLNNNELSIADRHTALKVMLTLQVMEDYQKEALPALAGLKAVSKEQTAFKSEMDGKLKKAGL